MYPSLTCPTAITRHWTSPKTCLAGITRRDERSHALKLGCRKLLTETTCGIVSTLRRTDSYTHNSRTHPRVTHQTIIMMLQCRQPDSESLAVTRRRVGVRVSHGPPGVPRQCHWVVAAACPQAETARSATGAQVCNSVCVPQAGPQPQAASVPCAAVQPPGHRGDRGPWATGSASGSGSATGTLAASGSVVPQCVPQCIMMPGHSVTRSDGHRDCQAVSAPRLRHRESLRVSLSVVRVSDGESRWEEPKQNLILNNVCTDAVRRPAQCSVHAYIHTYIHRPR